MVQNTILITNKVGIHLRPAGKICEHASKFHSKITLVHGDKNVNAKSLLSVLSACVRSGDEITLICEGDDEKEALDKLLDTIEEINHLYEEKI